MSDTADDDVAELLEPEIPEQLPWSRRAQAISAVIWPSFLAASFASLLFFALVDPKDLMDVAFTSTELDRMTGYGLSFLFFWLICFISSTLSVFLLRTARRKGSSKSTDR